MILGGAFAIIFSFVRAYQNFMFAQDPTLEILEMGRRSLRRGSSFIAHQQHRLLVHHRDSYSLLRHGPMATCLGEGNREEDAQPIIDVSLSGGISQES